MSEMLLKALSVTAELCGGELSAGAAKVIVAELSKYPEDAAVAALERVCREHEGRLTLPAILKRLDDGRPSADEAWAMVPKDEYTTAVLTHETMLAMDGAMDLYADGDAVAARMAFKAKYERLCQQARSYWQPVTWTPTLGWDKSGRAGPLAEAVSAGRLSYEGACEILGSEERQELSRLTGPSRPALANQSVSKVVAALAESLKPDEQ